MLCSNCGAKIKEDNRFCANCGNEINLPNDTVTQDETLDTEREQSKGFQTMTQRPNAVSSTKRHCFSCGDLIQTDIDICPFCGVDQNRRSSTTSMNVHCFSCGNSIKKEASVCPSCGVYQDVAEPKNWLTALLLAIFLGVGHRFYVGKTGTAVIMMLCFLAWPIASLDLGGLSGVCSLLFVAFVIWWIRDIYDICTLKFKDANGKSLKKNNILL